MHISTIFVVLSDLWYASTIWRTFSPYILAIAHSTCVEIKCNLVQFPSRHVTFLALSCSLRAMIFAQHFTSAFLFRLSLHKCAHKARRWNVIFFYHTSRPHTEHYNLITVLKISQWKKELLYVEKCFGGLFTYLELLRQIFTIFFLQIFAYVVNSLITSNYQVH